MQGARSNRSTYFTCAELSPRPRSTRSCLSPGRDRDVKSVNIVLDLALSPKRIDCGLSKFIPDQLRHGTIMSTCGAILGTPGYTCPKYASGGSEYDAKSENFSFGMESFCLSCFWEDCKASVKMTSLASTLTTKPHYLMTWT